MGIHNVSEKVVNSVNAVLPVELGNRRSQKSVEALWYLPYNITLNNLVCDTETIAVNAQHKLEYISAPAQRMWLIPDFAIIQTSPPTVEGGEFKTKVLAVVEIKTLTATISPKTVEGSEKYPGELFYAAHFMTPQNQARKQASAALANAPDQEKIIAIIAVGPYWKFLVYRRKEGHSSESADNNLPELETVLPSSCLTTPIWSLVNAENTLEHSNRGLSNLRDALVEHFDIE